MSCRVAIAAGVIGLGSLMAGCASESVTETSSQPSIDVPVVSNETSVPMSEQTVSPQPSSTQPSSTEPSSTERSSTTVTSVATVPQGDDVFAFENDDDLIGWNVVNDTVMGGVTSGELTWADEAMVFTGELSLDNNGGFASVRSPLVDPSAAARWVERSGLTVEMRGDGRSWAVEVRDGGASGGWLATVTPSVDDFSVIEIPWAQFEPVTRFLDPRPTNEALDPSRIALIALYLIDGVEEPFRLEVRSIT